MNAPKLTGLGDWYLQRQLKYFKQGVRGTHERDVFGKTMAPMAATLADDAAIANVSAFIGTLPDKSAPTTVSGNASDGRRLYESTCGSLPRSRRARRAGDEAPRAEGYERLVPGHATEEFQAGDSRRPSARHCTDRRWR